MTFKVMQRGIELVSLMIYFRHLTSVKLKRN